MILATHVIFTAYGFWLPNDPRGSGSDLVRSKPIYAFGDATPVRTRHSVAGVSHDIAVRLQAKQALLYPPVRFDGPQARAVARGFAEYVQRSKVAIHACAILPDHVHMVVGRHHYSVAQVVNLLKGAATRRLVAEGRHPLARHRDGRGNMPSPWGQRLWRVYLDSDEGVERAIQYTEENLARAGLPPQRWSFVTPYERTHR